MSCMSCTAYIYYRSCPKLDLWSEQITIAIGKSTVSLRQRIAFHIEQFDTNYMTYKVCKSQTVNSIQTRFQKHVKYVEHKVPPSSKIQGSFNLVLGLHFAQCGHSSKIWGTLVWREFRDHLDAYLKLLN